MTTIEIEELFFERRQVEEGEGIVQDEIAYGIADSGYDSESHAIYVSVKVEIGEAESSLLPFNIRVRLGGLFEVDEEQFNVQHLQDWVSQSALFILMPYLRENVYALSNRVGLRPPVLLPMYNVPTLVDTNDRDEQ